VTVKIYNQQQVKLSVFGIPISRGKGEDVWFSLAPTSPTFESVSSADGMVVRSRTNDRRYMLTLTLKAASPENTILATLHTADKASEAGQVGPFVCTDLNGTELVVGECWIAQGPTLEHAKSAPDREWQIEVVADVVFEGGHV
jgi:hypothetical protein